MSYEEAQARLEVAQLYQEMGQIPKAVRYYLAAADIYKGMGNRDGALTILRKVLDLEPGNELAKSKFKDLGGVLKKADSPAQGGSSQQPAATRDDAKPRASQSHEDKKRRPIEGVYKPVPWLLTATEVLEKIRGEIKSPPDPVKLPFFPLPKIDPVALARRVAQLEAKKKREAEKQRTAVASAFDSSQSAPAITSAGTGGFAVSKSKGSFGIAIAGRRRSSSSEGERKKRRSAIRGGNQSLAEAIRKRLGR